MAEYPPQICSPCPHIAHFEAKKTNYLEQNTTPQPQVKIADKSNIYEQDTLGTVGTLNSPDLKVSPLKGILKSSDAKCPCANPETQQQEPPKTLAQIIQPTPPEPPALPEDPARPPPLPTELHTGGTPAPELPCYMPQPKDAIPDQPAESMGPIGPWATGRVDWGPLSGLTGTRPVVDKYSITRYSEGEWRKHNKEVIDMAGVERHKAILVDFNGWKCVDQTQADVDKNQHDNTKRLSQREQEIHRWKCELERAIAAASEEISFMEEQRSRLKQASVVLQLPESIAGECLERRTARLDPELVRDEVEDELIKELALTAEIRDVFNRVLKDVEAQLEEDKTVKARLEYDWGDKKEAHEIDTINVALNNRSTTLMFKSGATILPDDQSSPVFWEHFTRETLQEGEATRQRSAALRGTLDAYLINASRDLRAQADRVELALSKRIACVEEIRIRLENELISLLTHLASVEHLIDGIRDAIKRLDISMKKAQTRLDNRLLRPRVENCRDDAHFGLVEEVKSIGESVAALQAQLKQAQESQASLQKARSDLEREIMVKRKTVEIDRDRTEKIRSYYPSATALSGY